MILILDNELQKIRNVAKRLSKLGFTYDEIRFANGSEQYVFGNIDICIVTHPYIHAEGFNGKNGEISKYIDNEDELFGWMLDQICQNQNISKAKLLVRHIMSIFK